MKQILLPDRMDFTQIDLEPIRPGWGRVWQGSYVTSDIHQIPGPLAIVCMNHHEFNEEWIDHQRIHAVLSLWIEDTSESTLPDIVIKSAVEAGACFLQNGINLYVHCMAGVSRSTYYTVALYMRLGMEFGEAMRHVASRRKVAWPNNGFHKHLTELEGMLR